MAKSAAYNTDIERVYERGFTIQERGYSFQFKTNFGKYKKWTRLAKKRIKQESQRLLLQWANLVAFEAKKRCPHYSGGLEEAIKVSGTRTLLRDNFGESRMSIGVGVDGRAWSSDYDEVVKNLVSKGVLGDAPLASPSLAILLHESWEQLAGQHALGRARRKGAHFGVTVGSHFLTRAYNEIPEEYKAKVQQATLRMQRSLASVQSAEAWASSALGMNEEDYEHDFSYEDNDEVPF